MSSKYSVDILPKANEALDHIYRYYYEESCEQAVADQVIGEIETAILALEDFPKAHPVSRIQRLAKKGYRNLIIGNYIALYKIDEKTKTVTVSYIFHGMTDYLKYI